MDSRLKISKDEFRAALSRFASGVTVVTTRDGENRLHGITVSAFCSVSLDPPLILVCIDRQAGSHCAFEQSRAFVVHILREDQQYLSDRFASQLPDKFEGVKYRAGIEHLPVLEDVLVSLECRLVAAHDGGDHTIYTGEIVVSTVNEGKPLIYFQGDYRKIGS
ncbi:MAG: flavin reductase family protein [Acidobacteriota bacterium]|nr:flavin reductase family protein [Acidobacteriota bacterium]